MLPDPPDTTDNLIPFIEATGESGNVDAKGPVTWDGGEVSASLTKDILAFANSRDGGVIVIGKQENEDHTFQMTGLSEAQAESFEVTKVATWVNNHCDPAVNLGCHTVEHNDKRFVVITIGEFEELPILCTKDRQSNDNQKFLLKRGTLYVRTANAESAPLNTSEQLGKLVGLAVTKRSDQLLDLFKRALAGQPLITSPITENKYLEEVANLDVLFKGENPKKLSRGSISCRMFPESYRDDRWSVNGGGKM